LDGVSYTGGFVSGSGSSPKSVDTVSSTEDEAVDEDSEVDDDEEDLVGSKYDGGIKDGYKDGFDLVNEVGRSWWCSGFAESSEAVLIIMRLSGGTYGGEEDLGWTAFG